VQVGGIELRAGVHLRHVMIEPALPTDALGFEVAAVAPFGGAAVAGALPPVAIASFALIGVGVISAAEESDLIRLGERVVGVSGVSTHGMTAAQVMRAIAAARAVTLGGSYALSLAEPRADAAVAAAPEEVAVQVAGAAFQMLGSKHITEMVQAAITLALAEPNMPLK